MSLPCIPMRLLGGLLGVQFGVLDIFYLLVVDRVLCIGRKRDGLKDVGVCVRVGVGATVDLVVVVHVPREIGVVVVAVRAVLVNLSGAVSPVDSAGDVRIGVASRESESSECE